MLTAVHMLSARPMLVEGPMLSATPMLIAGHMLSARPMLSARIMLIAGPMLSAMIKDYAVLGDFLMTSTIVLLKLLMSCNNSLRVTVLSL